MKFILFVILLNKLIATVPTVLGDREQLTGLGLSLSCDSVNVHGGEIKVKTKEGEGAEFVIVFSNSSSL